MSKQEVIFMLMNRILISQEDLDKELEIFLEDEPMFKPEPILERESINEENC